MDMKFTDDGKKVVVLGKLNKSESIVQEIFVDDQGNEIPSGNSFVVKSLHSEKLKSWKEKDIEETEKAYNDFHKMNEKRFDELKERERKVIVSIEEKTKYLESLNKNLQIEDFQTFFDLIEDKIKYVIIERYHLAIEEFDFDKIMVNFSSGRFDGIKLLSLFGDAKGKLTWRLSDYCDGSGSRPQIFLYKDLEMAKRGYLEKIKDSVYTKEIILQLKKWNMEIDSKKLDAYISMLQKRHEEESNNIQKKIMYEEESFKKEIELIRI